MKFMNIFKQTALILLAAILTLSSGGVFIAETICDICVLDKKEINFLNFSTNFTQESCTAETCCEKSEDDCNCVKTEYYKTDPFVLEKQKIFPITFPIIFKIIRPLKLSAVKQATAKLYHNSTEIYSPPDICIKQCRFLL